MELLKKTIHMNRMKGKVLSQVAISEDLNVPDNRPDVGTVVLCQGSMRVENVKTMENQVTVSGMLGISMLCLSEGEEKQLYRLELKLPVSERLNLEGAQSRDVPNVSCQVEDLRAQLINSRKISLQGVLDYRAEIEEIYDTQAGVELHGVEELSAKTKKLNPLSLAVQKKDILRVKEEIILPSNKPNIGEILWESVQLRGTNVRVADGKLDISGELFVFVLYESTDENRTRQWQENVLPFHGEVTCDSCRQDMVGDVEVTLSEANVEIKLDSDGENRIFGLDVVLGLDIHLYEEEEVEILEDVYTPRLDLQPVTAQEVYESLLIKNFSKCRASSRIRVEERKPRMLQICNSQGEIKIDDIRIVENGIQVDGGILVTILYISADDSNPFSSFNGMVDFSHLIQVDEIDKDSRYQLNTELEQLSATMIDSEEIEVKAAVNLNALVVKVHQQPCIVEVESREVDVKKVQELPGIVGYIVQPGDTLWGIAKSYYTTPRQIMEMNQLENEDVEVGKGLLLIKQPPEM